MGIDNLNQQPAAAASSTSENSKSDGGRNASLSDNRDNRASPNHSGDGTTASIENIGPLPAAWIL
jgi:hypothetical protein